MMLTSLTIDAVEGCDAHEPLYIGQLPIRGSLVNDIHRGDKPESIQTKNCSLNRSKMGIR